MSQENVEVIRSAFAGDDLGESVLALGEVEITGRRTGLNARVEVGELVTYRNGKTVCVRDFNSHAEALEAAGLRE